MCVKIFIRGVKKCKQNYSKKTIKNFLPPPPPALFKGGGFNPQLR